LVVRVHSGEPFPQVKASKPKLTKITLTGNSPLPNAASSAAAVCGLITFRPM